MNKRPYIKVKMAISNDEKIAFAAIAAGAEVIEKHIALGNQKKSLEKIIGANHRGKSVGQIIGTNRRDKSVAQIIGKNHWLKTIGWKSLIKNQ